MQVVHSNIHQKSHAKTGAKIALVVLWIYILAQFLLIYQTAWELTSPQMGRQIPWDISSRYVNHGIIVSGGGIVALVLFFFQKWYWVIGISALVIILNSIGVF